MYLAIDENYLGFNIENRITVGWLGVGIVSISLLVNMIQSTYFQIKGIIDIHKWFKSGEYKKYLKNLVRHARNNSNSH